MLHSALAGQLPVCHSCQKQLPCVQLLLWVHHTDHSGHFLGIQESQTKLGLLALYREKKVRPPNHVNGHERLRLFKTFTFRHKVLTFWVCFVSLLGRVNSKDCTHTRAIFTQSLIHKINTKAGTSQVIYDFSPWLFLESSGCYCYRCIITQNWHFKGSHRLFKNYFTSFKQPIKNNFQYNTITFLHFWANIITIYDTHDRVFLFRLHSMHSFLLVAYKSITSECWFCSLFWKVWCFQLLNICALKAVHAF